MTYLYNLWAQLRIILCNFLDKSADMLTLSEEKMVANRVQVVVRSRK